jgi:DNA-nicking Smr family endonuclease
MSADRRKQTETEVTPLPAGDDADWLDAISDVEQIDAEASGLDFVASEPTTGLAERFRQRQHVEPTITDDPAFAIDGHTMERIRRGKVRIEARVDLHGCTQEEAFTTVNQFLDQTWQAGQQLVLMITGKGTARDGGGVLRTAVPRWITEGRYRDCLVGIAAAEARDGGDGAIYVMLRKQR